jgi:hypothetical protein
MVSADGTTLTERQVEVLELRAAGHTQQEVAEMLGTTDSNVSAIERAAQENVAKARGTLELVRTVRAPVRFSVPAGTDFDDLVDTVFAEGNDAGVKLDYCRPELYSHLFASLEDLVEASRLVDPVDIGLTEDGEVTVFPDIE